VEGAVAALHGVDDVAVADGPVADLAGLERLADLAFEGDVEPESRDFLRERLAVGEKGIAPQEILTHEGTTIPRLRLPLNQIAWRNSRAWMRLSIARIEDSQGPARPAQLKRRK